MGCQSIAGLPPALEWPVRESKVSSPRTQHDIFGQDPNPDHSIPESSTFTTRSPHLPCDSKNPKKISIFVYRTNLTLCLVILIGLDSQSIKGNCCFPVSGLVSRTLLRQHVYFWFPAVSKLAHLVGLLCVIHVWPTKEFRSWVLKAQTRITTYEN